MAAAGAGPASGGSAGTERGGGGGQWPRTFEFELVLRFEAEDLLRFRHVPLPPPRRWRHQAERGRAGEGGRGRKEEGREERRAGGAVRLGAALHPPPSGPEAANGAALRAAERSWAGRRTAGGAVEGTRSGGAARGGDGAARSGAGRAADGACTAAGTGADPAGAGSRAGELSVPERGEGGRARDSLQGSLSPKTLVSGRCGLPAGWLSPQFRTRSVRRSEPRAWRCPELRCGAARDSAAPGAPPR